MDKLNEEEKKELFSKKMVVDFSIIYNMCRCLEFSTKRGSFEASELTFVGGLYDTLMKAFNEAIQDTLKKKVTTLPPVTEPPVTE